MKCQVPGRGQQADNCVQGFGLNFKSRERPASKREEGRGVPVPDGSKAGGKWWRQNVDVYDNRETFVSSVRENTGEPQ